MLARGAVPEFRTLDARRALLLTARPLVMEHCSIELQRMPSAALAPRFRRWYVVSRLEPQMRQYFAAATENDVRWLGAPHVLLLGENAAVVWGAHRFRSGSGAHDGVWTGALQRIGGEWRIVHSHSSDTVEGGGP